MGIQLIESIVNRVNEITDSQANEIKDAFVSSQNPKLFSNNCKFVAEKTISIGEDQTSTRKK